MSILPDFWTPSVLEFVMAMNGHAHGPATELSFDVQPLNYAFSVLISIVVGCTQVDILRKTIKRGWRRHHWFRRRVRPRKFSFESKSASCPESSTPSPFILIASSFLSIVTLATTILVCTSFLFRLGSIGVMQWQALEDAPTGAPVACYNPARFTDGKPCIVVKTPREATGGRLDMALGIIMQLLLHVADSLLVYRSYIIFSDKKWVYIIAGIPFVASIVSSSLCLFAVVLRFDYLPQTGLLSLADGEDDSNVGPATEAGYFYPFISVASSVLVNLVVTTSIVSRILSAGRRSTKLECQFASDLEALGAETGRPQGIDECTGVGRTDATFLCDRERMCVFRRGIYATTSALLVEAALPSAIFGILACLIQPYQPSAATPALIEMWKARYSVRMLWVSFTVLAPQMILLRVLQKRDAHSMSTMRKGHSDGGALSVIQFKRPRSRAESDGSTIVDETCNSIPDGIEAVVTHACNSSDPPRGRVTST